MLIFQVGPQRPGEFRRRRGLMASKSRQPETHAGGAEKRNVVIANRGHLWAILAHLRRRYFINRERAERARRFGPPGPSVRLRHGAYPPVMAATPPRPLMSSHPSAAPGDAGRRSSHRKRRGTALLRQHSKRTTSGDRAAP